MKEVMVDLVQQVSNKKIYEKFYEGLMKNGISKINILMKLRIRRQSIMETVALYFAMLFDKL